MYSSNFILYWTLVNFFTIIYLIIGLLFYAFNKDKFKKVNYFMFLIIIIIFLLIIISINYLLRKHTQRNLVRNDNIFVKANNFYPTTQNELLNLYREKKITNE